MIQKALITGVTAATLAKMTSPGTKMFTHEDRARRINLGLLGQDYQKRKSKKLLKHR